MVDPWIDVASRLGIPVALLAAVFYALWRMIQWFGINIALPVRDRSFGFLDKLEGTVGKLEDTVDKMGEQMAQQTEQIKAQTEKTHQAAVTLQEIEKKLSGVCKGNGGGVH